MIRQSMSLIEKKENRNMGEPFLLKPACKDYLWGGNRLAAEYGKEYNVSPLAETWECSTHPDGVSIVDSGIFKGYLLDGLLKEHPELLGEHPIKTFGCRQLPILVKLIDAQESASVQVHPDDAYAYANEKGESGKAEMWYILDAKDNAKIIYGFRQDVDAGRVKDGIEDGSIEKYLRKIKVKKDDVYFVEPGCVHAIGAGMLIAEIQQNSNLTYRLYDYNRKNKNGEQRKLHVKKALEVANLCSSAQPKQPMRVLNYRPGCATELLCRCRYFQVERMLVNTEKQRDGIFLHTDETSFLVLLCIEGEGSLVSSTELFFQKGKCIFVPANSNEMELKGKFQMLKIKC